jgi:hypothetical protein
MSIPFRVERRKSDRRSCVCRSIHGRGAEVAKLKRGYKWNFCVLRFSTCDRVRIDLTDEVRSTRGEDVYVIVDGKSALIVQDQKTQSAISNGGQ